MKRPVRKKFTKAQRELVCEIAQGAHTLGRLYTTGGEIANPGVQFERIHRMASESMKSGRLMFNFATAKAKP